MITIYFISLGLSLFGALDARSFSPAYAPIVVRCQTYLILIQVRQLDITQFPLVVLPLTNGNYEREGVVM